MKKQKQNALKLAVLELEQGTIHINIYVKVNGKRARFLIDTGASVTVVNRDWFEKTFGTKKLKSIKQEVGGLHSSVFETHIVSLTSLELGALALKNQTCAALDLSHVNSLYAKRKKPKIQGILGSDLMWKHKMIVDYGKGQLIIP